MSTNNGDPDIDKRLTIDACDVLMALMCKYAALMVHGRARVHGGDDKYQEGLPLRQRCERT